MEMNKQTSFIKVTVLQTDIVWEEAKVNRMAVEQLIEKHCDTDLFVLPEMFSTGFSMNPMEIAEDEGGETLQWMCRIAALRQCAIAGSLSVREAGNFTTVSILYVLTVRCIIMISGICLVLGVKISNTLREMKE